MAERTRGTGGGGGDPAPLQDELVSRRWFLERMAWVSSAAAAGTLVSPNAAGASHGGRPIGEDAFRASVRPQALDDLTELTLSEAMTLLRTGTVTPADIIDAHVDRIEAYDADYYKAFAARPTRAELLAQAVRTPASNPRAPLRGIPVAPKDNFYTSDLLTEGGSLVFEGFQPTYDATAVALMRAAGGLIIGKAQMGNLAGGRASVYGTDVATTRNAWTPNDERYSPAGSSSGSGTAVAARLAMVALGTQTGGSVMGPGTAQGLTCIKPTFGRISLHGIIPLSYTRDHVGPMARNAMDAAILLQVLARPDPSDPRTLGLPPAPDYVVAATPVGGVAAADSDDVARTRLRWPTRIGLWPGWLAGRSGGGPGGGQEPSEDELALRRNVVATLERLGADIVPDVSLPDDFQALTSDPLGGSHGDPTAFFIEHLRKDVRNFGSRLPRFLNGMLQSADTYVKVQQARCLLAHRMITQLFDQCDVVLGGSGGFDSVGFPLLCMPIGFATEERTASRVPRGVVMGAPPFGEERLLAVAAAYQAVTDFHTVRPPDPT